MKKCLELFLTMFKIGLFTFGGGYAMIALLENEFVSKKKWLEQDEFLDMVAISESTPGPIAANMATYIGYKRAGFFGSLWSTVGVALPSLIIIYIISLFLDAFLTLSIVESAFKGIRVCVVYLIISAGIKMLLKLKKNVLSTIILLVTIVCMLAFSALAVSFSTIFYIIVAGMLGLLVYLVGNAKGKGDEK